MPDFPTTNELRDLLQFLTPRERAEMDRLLLKGAPVPLWRPNPANRPQSDAWNSPADVIGYGGAAGGGKTDLGLGMALESPNHRHTLFLRREATQLRGVIERAREIIGDRGRFNENSHIWRGLPGGRMIEFGGCKDPGDEKQHQGRPHDLNIFDEATEFLETQVRFIMGWNRTTNRKLRAQAMLFFNPPTTADGEWVLRFFAPWLGDTPTATPGELRWFTTLPGEKQEREVESGKPFEHKGQTVYPRSRTFFPARVTDNPYWEGTGYLATLQSMPEPLRSQMLYGDMKAGKKDDAWQCLKTAHIEAAFARWEAMARPSGQRVLGVDVARGGDDATVIAERVANWIAPLEEFPGRETPTGLEVAGLIAQRLAAGGGMANIDVIGVGASAYDISYGNGLAVAPVNFSEGSDETDQSGVLRFQNKRAEAYWKLREAIDPGNPDALALPPDPQLKTELQAIRWGMGMRGVKIEDKDEIKKRIGRSPDRADAVALAVIMTGAAFDPAAYAAGLEAMDAET